jgi:MOSC domain-containing protein YiiM
MTYMSMHSDSEAPSILSVADCIEALEAVVYRDTGRVAGLIEKPAPGQHVARTRVEVVAGQGFAGDHPRKSWWRGELVPGREVTAMSQEVLAVLGIAPDVPGDNLITEGIDLRALQPGDRLVMGEVVLERSAKPHRPCALFRERTGPEAFEVASQGWRGALFVVRQGGLLSTSEAIQVQPLAAR